MRHAPITTILGRNIRYRRLLAGLTEKALAQQLGITLRRLQKFESGGDSPTCDEFVQIAAVLRCTADDLCRDSLDDIGTYAPEHPWNPYRVHTLISQFNRIRSHGVRNQVCGMVRMIADISASSREDTL